MTFEELLARYPRLCIAGAPRTGKSSLTRPVSDRPVIHTDDWKDAPWRDVPALIAEACRGLERFVVEGVRAPDALRTGGVEVDAVVWLSRPKAPQTDAQRSMGVGVHTVLAEWAASHPEIPIVTEDTLTVPTLDHADTARTRRFATWTLDASKLERTPQGGLRVPARLSKAGVFKYLRGERVVREYRPASELQKPQAIASLKGAPVVVLHPEVNGGAVDTENFRQLTVGHVEDPFYNADTEALEGVLVINDADAIARIERGELSDISCAYDNGRDFTPGFSPAREPYDLVQTDYVFNHAALGPRGWGRQGTDVGLLTLDADDHQVAALPPVTTNEESMAAKTDDKTAPPPPPAGDKNKTQDSPGALPAAVAAPPAPPAEPPKTADEGLTPEDIVGIKALVAMLPALNQLVNTGAPPASSDNAGAPPDDKKTLDAADIERIAQEGAELRAEAVSVLGKDYSTKHKTNRQIRLDVIRSFDSKFQDAGRSDEAIAVAYEVAVKASEERSKNAAELAKTRRAGTRSQDQTDPPRKAFGSRAYEAWKS